jgi:hypothetical protein
MSSLDAARPPRLVLAAVAAALAFAALVLMGSGATDARAAKPSPAVGLRLLPALELVSRAGRGGQPPVAVSNATLVLEKGVVGLVTDAIPLAAATELHGFLLRAGAEGKLTRIDVPDAPGTAAFGIDDRGRIAGPYENPNAVPAARRTGVRGRGLNGYLLRDGVQGPATRIDFPGAEYTAAFGIDKHGKVIGLYQDLDAAPSTLRNRAPAAPLPDALGLFERKENR